MSTTLYGIPNCDTCRKARKWLDAAGIEYRFHDFRKDGINAGWVSAWLSKAGADKLLNKRGTTWRKLSEAERDRASGKQLATLLTEQPTLIKRPVLEHGDLLLVGFNEAGWKQQVSA